MAQLAQDIHAITGQRINGISGVTRRLQMLSVNAHIEAAHAGELGRGFAVVASEVSEIALQVRNEAQALEHDLVSRVADLSKLGTNLVSQVYGSRLVDLAHNLIDVIDRNLYERSCDVRWWATEATVVAACTGGASSPACASRLVVILRAYTVYADIVVLDRQGRVLANGHPDTAPLLGQDFSSRSWFVRALATATGDEFVVDDIARETLLGNRAMGTYATAVRRDGAVEGAVIGAIAVMFDWERQAQTAVEGVRLEAAERDCTRSLILDGRHRVIAASDRHGVLEERLPLPDNAAPQGWVSDGKRILAWALTPGYETYRGLGWYGAIVRNLG